jgi:UDP-N-acetyl-D-glucosamine dehydrogenase
VLICVPTPLTPNREPELGALIAAGRGLADVAQRGQLIVLESTTYPGTTRERLVPLLEESGLRVGEDVNVAFSPERVDPGRTDYSLRDTPKVVGGMSRNCTERAAELYGRICDTIVRVSTPEAAEMTKLLENIFRSVNIALVNELAILSGRMGIDIWEVIDAAATKPYGFMRFDPGPGMGGHCLPVDPFYLTWRAREFHMSTEFIELALRIIEVLRGHGAELRYHDAYVPALAQLDLYSLELDEAIADADAVVLVTAHPNIDYGALAASHPLFIDFRGATRRTRAKSLVGP